MLVVLQAALARKRDTTQEPNIVYHKCRPSDTDGDGSGSPSQQGSLQASAVVPPRNGIGSGWSPASPPGSLHCSRDSRRSPARDSVLFRNSRATGMFSSPSAGSPTLTVEGIDEDVAQHTHEDDGHGHDGEDSPRVLPTSSSGKIENHAVENQANSSQGGGRKVFPKGAKRASIYLSADHTMRPSEESQPSVVVSPGPRKIMQDSFVPRGTFTFRT